MAKIHLQQKRFAGISDSEKEGMNSQYLFARSIDYRTDPTKLPILPKTVKESGSIVVDLPMWGDRVSDDLYFYGNTGHIYKKSSDVYSDLRTVASSVGNGLKYFNSDDFMYYTNNIAIGRYGPMAGTKTFADDYLGAEGGVPLNTASLALNGTTQYVTAADSAELSEAGDLSFELSAKTTDLPAVGESRILISKWLENGNERSYRFELYGISGYFGDSAEGALTISTNTTQAPVDSAATGTASVYTLTATNASFAVGDKILIHQTRGTNAGVNEENEIAGYTAGTITVTNPLENTYSSGAQVMVLEEYTNVTVNSGKTWTAKAWNGTVGGILAFKASGTVTITGTISAKGKGFRNNTSQGQQGEGTDGAGSINTSANGNGGGGGGLTTDALGGGGGGNGTEGAVGVGKAGHTSGGGGEVSGTNDLTTITFGGAGGDGAGSNGWSIGGDGGGIVYISGTTIAEITGEINCDGNNGVAIAGFTGSGGGGAGGSILLKAQTATLGTNKISAAGGVGGTTSGRTGGSGGAGRIHIDYYTSYTGTTTTPVLDASQDDSLVTNVSYQMRFGVSSNGTNEEFIAKTLSSTPTLSQWYRWGMAFDASESTVYFYLDGSLVGQSTGTFTSINDSTALFAYGASFDSAGDPENFWKGKIDDGRMFDDIRSANEFDTYKEVELSGSEAGLVAYHEMDSSTADSSANSNTLTLVGSAAYDTDDVPFPSPTTRQDVDQSLNTSGNTYTLTTAIDEGATHRQSFVPDKDPQKSIEVLIAAIGTGNWTLTVHDAKNREIAAKTVVVGDLNAGDFEFIFDSVWTPIIGQTYHFHLTSTVADGTVTTTDANDLETVDYHTYYQFLVSNSYHPIEDMLDFLAIGNGRYVAKLEAGSIYDPHKLTLPAGFSVRCLGKWREYLVIGTYKGDELTDHDVGYLFFWDGTSTTYNFYVPIKEGGVNAIISGDPLLFIAGYSGDLLSYQGGKPTKILRFPKMDGKKTMEVYPGGAAMWRALAHISVAGDSNSTSLEKGVYSYGKLFERLAETLSYDYPLSIGNRTGTDIDTGMLFATGTELYIGWRNETSYGIDTVSPTNDPFSTATIEFLITDVNKIWAEKQSQFLRGYFKSIVDGDSINLKYKIDRETDWNEGTAITTEDETEIRLPIPTKGNRFNEFQFAVDMATTNSTSPEFYGIGMQADNLNREGRT